MHSIHRVPLIILLASVPARACIWDYDTLRDERRGLPGFEEILTGHFEKRSAFFYSDRIARMEKLLEARPDDQDAIDNLAVALFRVGRRQEAIDKLLEKEKRFPDQYTTSSNLATFYMLMGDSARAIPLLEKALAINPQAHFGREKYQLQLARFLVKAKSAGEYPLEDFLGTMAFDGEGEKIEPDFHFISSRRRAPPGPGPMPQEEALTAIAGMVRFGTEESPDLLFAMGNLLNLHGDRNLAIRAYARAIELRHPRSTEIRSLLEATQSIISPPDRGFLATFAGERDRGSAWAKKYMDYADGLIRSGKDPDDESNYRAFYAASGPSIDLSYSWGEIWAILRSYQVPIAIGAVAIAGIGLFIRRRRQASKARALQGPITGR